MIALKLAKVKGTISQSNYRLHLRELELIPVKCGDGLTKKQGILKRLPNYLKMQLTFYI
jgi:glucosamine--fructose-6-phosphate aminotransferase (isomerizing)